MRRHESDIQDRLTSNLDLGEIAGRGQGRSSGLTYIMQPQRLGHSERCLGPNGALPATTKKMKMGRRLNSNVLRNI